VPSETTHLDVVVFDLGNVLVEWDRRLLYAQLIDDPAELDRFLDEVLTLEVNAELDRGASLAAVTDALVARHPGQAELIGAFRTRWLETLGAVLDDTVAIVEELAAMGLRLLALTNWGRETFAMSEPRLTFLRHFEGVVVSGREGVVKPDPAIFEILCRRHGVEPATAVFVDDSAANIATARALGFHTVHFRDGASCRAELRALGLDLVVDPP
jgi:2-haloacid dehalogenase